MGQTDADKLFSILGTTNPRSKGRRMTGAGSAQFSWGKSTSGKPSAQNDVAIQWISNKPQLRA